MIAIKYREYFKKKINRKKTDLADIFHIMENMKRENLEPVFMNQNENVKLCILFLKS